MMIVRLKKACATGLLTVSLLSGLPSPASAQFGGFFGSGAFDILGTLTGILDQAEAIASAAEILVANGNFGELAPLLPEIEAALELLEQAEQLSFAVETVLQEFEEVYPADYDDLDLFQTISTINQSSLTAREAIERSLEIGANTIQGQLPSAIRTETVRTVGTVGGPAAALQAIVNLQAEQINQLSSLQTLLVTQSRVLSLEQAERSSARERSRRLLELDDPTTALVEDPDPIRFGLDR